MSTHQWFHQHFSPRELAGYPCKDVATYWQCEDYPKASVVVRQVVVRQVWLYYISGKEVQMSGDLLWGHWNLYYT